MALVHAAGGLQTCRRNSGTCTGPRVDRPPICVLGRDVLAQNLMSIVVYDDHNFWGKV